MTVRRSRPPKLPKSMSSYLVDECIDVLANYTGYCLSTDQLKELMSSNQDLQNQLIKFNSPNDTMDREDLMDAFALKVTGRSWPLNYEGAKAFEDFEVLLNETAAKLGYAKA